MSVDITPEVAAKLAELRAPFAPEYVGKLPKVTCKACSDNKQQKHCQNHQRRECPICKNYMTTQHIHLDYIGHAETTDRLLKVDPAWSWEPQARDVNPQALAAALATGNPEIVHMVIESAPPKLDQFGGMWINLTVLGVTRPGYGDATGKPAGPMAIKEVIGDAIRNASMRFGVGLDLWSKSDMGEIEAERLRSLSEGEQARQQQDRAAEGRTRQLAPAPAPAASGEKSPPTPAEIELIDGKKAVIKAAVECSPKYRLANGDPDIPVIATEYTRFMGNGAELKNADVDELRTFAEHLTAQAPARAA